jgi:hypothetical protein
MNLAVREAGQPRQRIADDAAPCDARGKGDLASGRWPLPSAVSAAIKVVDNPFKS